MKLNNLTVIIHSYNDEENIVACIDSAKLLFSNILVIDMHSADNTIDLAKKNGATVFLFPESKYVEPAREFGINKAKTEWVFILDSDERITSELANEIKSVVSNQLPVISKSLKPTTDYRPLTTHYKIPRKNIFAKVKWLRYGGWWPDHQIRLVNKKFFMSWSKQIHSTPVIDGQIGFLTNPIVHYFHGDLEAMVRKTIIFEDIESNLLLKADKNVVVPTFFRKFLGELFRRLVQKLGFMDGEIGIIESIYQAFSKTITYIYLYEKSRTL